MIVGGPESGRGPSRWTGAAGVGAVALAIGCCAAAPLLVALAGSIAVGTLLGIGAGAIALILLVALVVLRARRRATCQPPGPM
jgi:hypothetical protein